MVDLAERVVAMESEAEAVDEQPTVVEETSLVRECSALPPCLVRFF